MARHHSGSHVGIVVEYTHQDMCPAYGKMCAGCGKMGHFKKVCCSKRSREVNEIEVETSQETAKAKLKQ